VTRRGFTLLEVLAAVALLVIVYTLLASSAMQGNANEGENVRRLAASLLADRTLAGIEIQLAQQPPDLGVQEMTEGIFEIAVETRALDLSDFAAAAQEATPRGTSPGGGERSTEGAFQLLAAPRDQGASPLVEIQVAVRWMEGHIERMVTRTTFAADARVVGPLVQALAGEQASAAEQQAAEEGKEDAEQEAESGEFLQDEGSGSE
jgi:prepilin-type N-terminal cleavage/methylation domain-containing protein